MSVQDEPALQWQALAGQQSEIAELRKELQWTQDQLQRMRSTKIWRFGTFYWHLHAGLLSIMQRREAGLVAPLPNL